MGQTRAGAKKAAATIKAKYGTTPDGKRYDTSKNDTNHNRGNGTDSAGVPRIRRSYA